ncbi:putative transcriptional regulator [Spongiibacter sp. IMCC21906]|jgi:ArsR family transcriptional regulator|nr:metalloregulator ArsR/SmtB family transcription factor [Spongiibacter sp. IMCC21906]AKH67792.1 putative transcriptional regulator [Spongiibacter sp. IMCC21906]
MISTTQLFKCLADDTRLMSTLLIFKQGELCVCELMVALEDSQPKISRHLAQLRSCGILSDRRDKQWVYYSLHPELADWVIAVLEAATVAEHTPLEQASKRLSSMDCRPERCA